MTRSKLAALTIASLVCIGLTIPALSLATLPAAADHAGNQGVNSYVARQSDRCVDVQPLGDGGTNVSEFYDYRTGFGTDYSSYGTEHLQQSQVSQVFLYHGSDALSLVFLHDTRESDGEGGSITMEITGLPPERKWVVEDDDYGNSTDDTFEHEETSSEIDWMWSAGRTDGAAVQGLGALGDGTIEIEPAFGEESRGYESGWPWATDDLDWRVRYGPGEDELVPLDKSEELTIARGECESSRPTANLEASPSAVTSDDPVTLDASSSNDEGTIVEYRWDFDGDGSVDETTTDEAVATTSYNAMGTITPTVTVVDDSGDESSATATVTVDDTPPVARASADPVDATVGQSITFDGTAATDNVGIDRYNWTFGDGDLTVGEPGEASTVTHAYGEPGNHTARLTVTDEAGNRNETTLAVQVSDGTAPTAVVDGPDTTPVNESVTFDGSDSTDNGGVEGYDWTITDVGGATVTTGSGETFTHAFTHAGTYQVRLNVSDAAGNADVAEHTVEVTAPDAPTSSIESSADFTVERERHTWFNSTSTDDTGIARCDWTFEFGPTVERRSGDGLGWGNGSTNCEKSYSFAVTGTYDVTLTVTDESGHTDTTTRTVDVVPKRPVREEFPQPEARLWAPDAVEWRSTYFLNASNSTSEDPVRYYIRESNPDHWSDDEENLGQSTEFWTHYGGQYDRIDVAVGVLTVNDQTDWAWETIDILPIEPPNAVVEGPDVAAVGNQTTFDASNSTDNDRIRYYNWTVTDARTGETVHTDDGATTAVQFTEPGTYDVTVRVGDYVNYSLDGPQHQGVATKTVTVTRDGTTNEAPTVSASATAQTVTVDEDLTLSANATDPDGTVERVEWDFGSGDTATGASVTHAYGNAGTYTATATAVDDDGATASASVAITVEQSSNGDSGGNAGDGDSGGNAGDGDSGGDGGGDSDGSSGNSNDDDGGNSGGSDGSSGGGGDNDGSGSGGGSGNSGSGASGGGGGGGGGPLPPVDDEPEETTSATANRTANGSIAVAVEYAKQDEAVSVDVPGGQNGSVRLRSVEFVPIENADRMNVTLVPSEDPSGPDGVEDTLYEVRLRNGSAVERVTYAFALDPTVLSSPGAEPRVFVENASRWTAVEHTETRNGSTMLVNVTADRSGRIALASVAPDVTTTAVSMPGVPVVGQSVPIRTTLTNDGLAAAKRTIELAVDGTVVASKRVTVPAKGTVTPTLTVTFESVGDRRVAIAGTERTVFAAAADGGVTLRTVELASQQIAPGDQATIRATFENTGPTTGTAQANVTIDGELVSIERVVVEPGERGSVTFTESFDAPGTFSVGVNGEQRTLTVGEATASPTASGPTTPGSSPTGGPDAVVLVAGFGVLVVGAAALSRLL